MVKFRKALTRCVSEIDAIIGSDGSVSDGRLFASSQTQETRSKLDMTAPKDSRKYMLYPSYYGRRSPSVVPDEEIEEIPTTEK